MTFQKKTAEYAELMKSRLIENDIISDELYSKYGVNRGLRDLNGKGVLTGLTNISKIVSFDDSQGKHEPCDGQLWYRGYNAQKLVKEYAELGFGFERTAFLLMFGEKPTDEETMEFVSTLARNRNLPRNFVRDVIMKAPGRDVMNSMTRSILTLASYDQFALDSDIANNIRQCLMLIATFPMCRIWLPCI